jgi:outer membrane protein
MRRTPFATAALVLLAFAGGLEAQVLKIGYINSQQILASSPDAAAAQQRFDQEMQGFQAEVEQLEAELTRLQERLQQQQLTLSPEARANREQQIQQRLQAYQARTAELQRIADRRRAELIQPVMDRITSVIEAIREEGRYSLILDVAAGAIVAADTTLDLTPEVLRRLGGNTAAPAPSPSR